MAMVNLTCRRAKPEDWQAITEISRLAFEDVAKHPDALAELQDETWFSVQNWLVAEVDGRVVSAMGLRPGVMWMQGVAMPTATVGTVGTRVEVRGKGIGLELVRYAGGVVKEEGLALSRLNTWATRYAFYGRAGYVKAITNSPHNVMNVEVLGPELRAKCEAALNDGMIRPAHPRDAARLNEIYEATYSRVTGCLSRNEHFFLRRIARRPKFWLWYAPKVDLVESPKSGVVAYVIYGLDDERQEILEFAALPGKADAARALLLHVAREAQRMNIRKVDCLVDPPGPLGWILGEFNAHALSDSAVFFLQVHDAPQFLKIASGIMASACERHEIELTLSLAGLGDVTLGGGRPLRIVTDAGHLAALLYNGAWFPGLLGQGSVFVHPDTLDAHEAVRRIFPDTRAFRCKLDGY